jgi:hypothetical protein
MKSNLISLPSGIILNIDCVAYIAPLPKAANRRRKIRVVFGTIWSGASDGSAVNIMLNADDSSALIQALAKRNVGVTALRRATMEKE